jgi:cell division septation protein DedD
VSSVTKEKERDQAIWTGRQMLASLAILTILCGGFYSMGLYIGRWSSMPGSVSSAAIEPSAQAAETGQGSATEAVAPDQAILPPPSEKYSVQIAPANSREEADEILKRLRNAGFDSAHILEPEPDSVAQFYIIRVGPYKPDIAEQVAEELRQEHGFKNVQVMPRQVE